MDFIIRPIKQKDNSEVKELVIKVLLEHGAQGDGFASADPELECMFESYQNTNSFYWVIVLNNKIAGVGGIGQLKGEGEEYCELQKMYFLKELRGFGAGRKLMNKCLSFARKRKYKYCYLETLPNMKIAQSMYKSFNFKGLKNRLGGTGHSSCPVFMLLNLSESNNNKILN